MCKLVKLLLLSFIFFVSANSVFADVTSTLMPIADGGEDSSIWNNTSGSACDTVDCYVEVDETSGSSCTNSDGNISFIESNNGITGQTFDIDESSIPDGYTVTQIDITTCYKKSGGATATFQTRYCNDGSCVSSGSNIIAGVTYMETIQSFPVYFSKSALSDIEIGVINTEADSTVAISQIKTAITYSPPDVTAPSAVSDLATSGATQTTIDLGWTAPGDDGSSGTATTYDIRYSTSNITNDTDFNNATQVTGEPTPSVAGTAESMTVTDLSSDTTYYFAIKTSDRVPNTSALSNVPSGTTTAVPDTTPPSAVSDLLTSSPGLTSMGLSWTAPGDDGSTGTATTYDVRYSTTNITAGNWAGVAQATGEPTPSIAGTAESMTVTGLNIDTTYYFAIRTSDEVPNTSDLSNSTSGTTTSAPDTTPPLGISDLSASNPSETTIDLDWTASGDDGGSGTATTYDIRYSTSNIANDTDFNNANLVTGEPTPSIAGTTESMTVTGLSDNTTYYFAIKVSDEVPNTSALSNVPSDTTTASSGIIIPPAGGGGVAPSRVSFSGWAFPGSQVKILIKSDIDPAYKNVPVSTYNMSKEGIFSLDYLALLTGKYFIGLRGVDKTGQETGILSFNVDFRTETGLFVDDIIIPPTVSFSEEVVGSGENFNISGYSFPTSKIELKIDDILKDNTISDTSGYYSFSFSSDDFEKRSHYVRVRQLVDDRFSSYSFPRTFKISELEIPKADFNNDDKVNITDWSVFLFRWGSESASIKSKIDMDGNGKIDIVDFSIFLKAIKI